MIQQDSFSFLSFVSSYKYNYLGLPSPLLSFLVFAIFSFSSSIAISASLCSFLTHDSVRFLSFPSFVSSYKYNYVFLLLCFLFRSALSSHYPSSFIAISPSTCSSLTQESTRIFSFPSFVSSYKHNYIFLLLCFLFWSSLSSHSPPPSFIAISVSPRSSLTRLHKAPFRSGPGVPLAPCSSAGAPSLLLWLSS